MTHVIYCFKQIVEVNDHVVCVVERQDVFQKVLASLDELVTDPVYRPGDRLPPERELAGRLGVSRTLVRQALKLLEAAGKVVSRMGSGTYVADMTRRTNPCLLSCTVPNTVDMAYLEKLVDLRSLVEEKIFLEFCARCTEGQIDELVRLLEENMREDLPGSELMGLDMSFEEKVGEFVGNDLLYCVQSQLHQTWIMAWTRYGYVPESQEVLHTEHLGLLQALHARDKNEVSRRIVQHVKRAHEECGDYRA